MTTVLRSQFLPTSFEIHQGFALVGHVIKTLPLFLAECMMVCQDTLSCFSVNVYKDGNGECVLFDFENGLDGWTQTGTAFKNQPTYGDNPLFRGSARSNHKGDWWIGTYENRPSPSHPAGEETILKTVFVWSNGFIVYMLWVVEWSTICSRHPCQHGGECILHGGPYEYVCNCTGGYAGRNCEKKCVLFDFENGLDGWTQTGTAFKNQPTYGDNTFLRTKTLRSNHRGDWWIATYENRPSPSHPAGVATYDGPQGTMTSPKFIIKGTALTFLIGGGNDIKTERVELLIEGAVIAQATGLNTPTMAKKSFDVTSYRGQIAQLRFIDGSSSGWGHITVDQFEDSIYYNIGEVAHDFVVSLKKWFEEQHIVNSFDSWHECVLFDFENGLDGWTQTGTAFKNQPTYGDNSLFRGQGRSNHKGDWWIGTFENRPSPSHPAGKEVGDGPKGTMASPKFIIKGTALTFLIGGGNDIKYERVQLLIEGAVIAKATGSNSESMARKSFDVTSYRGQIAQLRVIDGSSSGWGHINVDHFEDSICMETSTNTMKERNSNKIPNNLPQLQNLIKRDAESYKEEFLQQYRHYQSNLQIFNLNPSNPSKTLQELVTFLCQVAHCYAEELGQLPQDIKDLLHKHHSVMDSELRMTLCKALILLRNKDLLSPTSLLELFFKLFRCPDKLLRQVLYNHIVTDIKNINAKHRNNKVNNTLQNFLYTMLKDSNAVAAKKSLDVMIELYRRNVWKDAKTVNVITTACFSPVSKVLAIGYLLLLLYYFNVFRPVASIEATNNALILVAALKFFLGNDDSKDDSDSDSEPEKPTAKQLLHASGVKKKNSKKKKKIEKALSVLRKQKKKHKTSPVNFSALHLINDPQGFAERLFKQLEVATCRFEIRIMMMNLISRLIGIHQLFLFNFYPFLQRYLQPHQREVTKLLTCFAQACHELVPPEVIEAGVKTIANNFVTERNSHEVMAVGINALREVCTRCPLVMTDTLLQDLSQYKKSKDKSVMMASKSLIQLFRSLNPELLHKKDRGKPTESTREMKTLQYGAVDSKDYIPGAEILDEEPTEKDDNNQDNVIDVIADEWESADDDSDGEWIDIRHSSDEEIQQNEDEDKEDKKVEEEDDEEEEEEDNDSDDDDAKSENNKDSVEDIHKANKKTAQDDENKAKASKMSQMRILTDEDFKKIRQNQMVKELQPQVGKNRKRPASADTSQQSERSELVSLDNIEQIYKKRKHDKASRLETVLEGRKDRPKFAGKKKTKMNEHASTTNKEKRRTKNFMMMRHNRNVRGKVKRSFRDKQVH
ncbi:hypothetical protein QZH41_013081 [Actinostola sp. cb2023]|nr:hypothetical protein QZH41_013081 [Actinostola sp. cb2023]